MITLETLSKFCAQPPMLADREWLTKPFTLEGWTYATDGRIAIRVSAVPDVPAHDLLPKAVVALFPTDEGRTWSPVPVILQATPKCERCGGTGKHECVCGDQHGCVACQGRGERWTMGSKASVVMFGEIGLHPYYVDKLRLLPGVKLSATGGPHDPVAIKFDGGEGVLMPMRI